MLLLLHVACTPRNPFIQFSLTIPPPPPLPPQTLRATVRWMVVVLLPVAMAPYWNLVGEVMGRQMAFSGIVGVLVRPGVEWGVARWELGDLVRCWVRVRHKEAV